MELNEYFVKAMGNIGGGGNVFVTGRAGTGKSTLLRYLTDITEKNFVIVAPTGIAALNVGGVTFHSFFRLPPRFVHPDDAKKITNPNRLALIRRLDMLIIDEVSMVRADIMDVVDRFFRINRESDEPFGGVQIVMFGDMYQLPPITPYKKSEAQVFNAIYPSPFFFDAKVFRDGSGFRTAELEKVYRQSDLDFIDALNSVRVNRHPDLAFFNSRLMDIIDMDEGKRYITLAPTNAIVYEKNMNELRKLPPPMYGYPAKIEGKFNEKDAPAEVELLLKVGAQVVFVRNDNQFKRWVNGTLGVVTEMTEDCIRVRTEDGTLCSVGREVWKITDYKFVNGKIVAEEVGSFEQFPLKLAWAMTIHKSQGQTYERMVLDTGRGMFAHGQLYVALSRCVSSEGLVLKKRLFPKDVIVDRRVSDYFREAA